MDYFHDITHAIAKPIYFPSSARYDSLAAPTTCSLFLPSALVKDSSWSSLFVTAIHSTHSATTVQETVAQKLTTVCKLSAATLSLSWADTSTIVSNSSHKLPCSAMEPYLATPFSRAHLWATFRISLDCSCMLQPTRSVFGSTWFSQPRTRIRPVYASHVGITGSSTDCIAIVAIMFACLAMCTRLSETILSWQWEKSLAQCWPRYLQICLSISDEPRSLTRTESSGLSQVHLSEQPSAADSLV